jgi:hypothetical protein
MYEFENEGFYTTLSLSKKLEVDQKALIVFVANHLDEIKRNVHYRVLIDASFKKFYERYKRNLKGDNSLAAGSITLWTVDGRFKLEELVGKHLYQR